MSNSGNIVELGADCLVPPLHGGMPNRFKSCLVD